MTDFGRRLGTGDMLKSVYDANDDGVVDAAPAHKASHQAGGSDEVAVTGLVGTTPNAILGEDNLDKDLRAYRINIANGTNASTVKVYVNPKFNAIGIAEEDNLAKLGSTTSFKLNGDGSRLTIKASAVGYVTKKTLAANVKRNLGQVALDVWHSQDGDDVFVQFYNAGTGAPADLTAMVDTGVLRATLVFITR